MSDYSLSFPTHQDGASGSIAVCPNSSAQRPSFAPGKASGGDDPEIGQRRNGPTAGVQGRGTGNDGYHQIPDWWKRDGRIKPLDHVVAQHLMGFAIIRRDSCWCKVSKLASLCLKPNGGSYSLRQIQRSLANLKALGLLRHVNVPIPDPDHKRNILGYRFWFCWMPTVPAHIRESGPQYSGPFSSKGGGDISVKTPPAAAPPPRSAPEPPPSPRQTLHPASMSPQSKREVPKLERTETPSSSLTARAGSRPTTTIVPVSHPVKGERLSGLVQIVELVRRLFDDVTAETFAKRGRGLARGGDWSKVEAVVYLAHKCHRNKRRRNLPGVENLANYCRAALASYQGVDSEEAAAYRAGLESRAEKDSTGSRRRIILDAKAGSDQKKANTLVEGLKSRGFTLWLERETPHISPVGDVDEEDMAELKSLRCEVVNYLRARLMVQRPSSSGRPVEMTTRRPRVEPRSEVPRLVALAKGPDPIVAGLARCSLQAAAAAGSRSAKAVVAELPRPKPYRYEPPASRRKFEYRPQRTPEEKAEALRREASRKAEEVAKVQALIESRGPLAWVKPPVAPQQPGSPAPEAAEDWWTWV